MAAPIIWSGNSAKLLKPILDFFGQAQILSGTVDPTSVATSAPKGSLYLNTSNGNTYKKTDSGSSTNWIIMANAASWSVDNFSGTGSQTAFTLTSAPGSVNNMFISINGVLQLRATYSVSGTTLTFTEAPPLGTNNIDVAYGTAISIGTPAAGSVVAASMGNASVGTLALIDDSVTQAKLAAKTTNTTSAALGQVLITASNGIQSGITTATDITNATGTIVSKGRPVIVSLSPIDTGANTAIESASTSNPADIRGEVWLYRNGSVVMKTSYGGYVAATGVTAFRGYVSLPVVFTDVNAPAGSNTYKIKIVPSSGTVSVSNVRMIAYEL